MSHRTLLVVLALVASPAQSRAEWALHGAPVSAVINGQGTPMAVADGAGGGILVWTDYRSGNADVYAQRLSAAGEPLWTINGRAICALPGAQLGPAVIPDGAGGAFVTWYDDRLGGNFDIYAQRISPLGDPMWTANGVLVCGAANHQQWPTISSDLAGGAVIGWADRRLGMGYEIYAQRLDAMGGPLWAANGVAVSTGMVDRGAPVSTHNGLGGAILAWADRRNGNWDIYARSVAGNGVAQGTNGGYAVCTAPNDQDGVRISSAGIAADYGAYLVWNDRRNPSIDLYARYVWNSGVPQWAANGAPVVTTSETQGAVRIASDGGTGAILVWEDHRNGEWDLYGQRIDTQGAALWGPYAIPICEAAGSQTGAAVVPDGEGGALVAWRDRRNEPRESIYAQRVTALGALRWGASGAPLCDLPEFRSEVTVAGDGAGNALVAWNDLRSGHADVYAQRVDGRYGVWGLPEPVLDSVDDRPADQGGQVVVRWQASQRDRVMHPLVSHYSVWRSTDPASPATAGSIRGTGLVDPAVIGPGFAGRAVWAETTAAGSVYWEWVTNQSAAYLPSYSAIVPTRGDSVAGDPAEHGFKVLAHETQFMPARIWESNVAFGHSTDDLAPAAPLALTAQRHGAGVYLRWNPAGDSDLRDYAIYRSMAPGVAPEPGAFVAAASDTAAWDSAAPPASLYYVVTAFDVHGNESAPSNEAEVEYGVTAVGAPPALSTLAVLPAQPNPFTHGTALRFGLPRPGDVAVRIVDAAGRRVRSLDLHGAAGWQSVRLDARDDSGRPLASGVYMYAVSAGGTTARGKLVVTR